MHHFCHTGSEPRRTEFVFKGNRKMTVPRNWSSTAPFFQRAIFNLHREQGIRTQSLPKTISQSSLMGRRAWGLGNRIPKHHKKQQCIWWFLSELWQRFWCRTICGQENEALYWMLKDPNIPSRPPQVFWRRHLFNCTALRTDRACWDLRCAARHLVDHLNGTACNYLIIDRATTQYHTGLWSVS